MNAMQTELSIMLITITNMMVYFTIELLEYV